MNRQSVITGVIGTITVLTGAFGGFWVQFAPPEISGKGNVKLAVSLASFITLGLFLAVAAIARERTARKIWIGAGTLFLAAGIVFSLIYAEKREKLVEVYQLASEYPDANESPEPFVRGSEYTSVATKLRERLGEDVANDQYLLENLGGKPSNVWTEESIEQNRVTLIRSYIPCFVLLCVAVMCFAETRVQETPRTLSSDNEVEQPPAISTQDASK